MWVVRSDEGGDGRTKMGTNPDSSHSMGTVNHGPETGHGSWQERATASSDKGMTHWWEEKHTLLTSMIQQTKKSSLLSDAMEATAHGSRR